MRRAALGTPLHSYSRHSPFPTRPLSDPTPLAHSAGRIVVAAAAAFVAGVMNAIAGGGTLLTFPALVAAGLPPLVANATSTVALMPGALSSMLGYRAELQGARRWALSLTVPSLLGGALGAWALLRTPATTFGLIVPWLVLGATALFLVQRPLLAWAKQHEAESAHSVDVTQGPVALRMLLFQFAVGIYGGYFGAGVGIFMLAALGFMGLTNIHRMNGLKNWSGFCMNIVATLVFALSGIVDWTIALTMAVGAIAGGYIGSRSAQRLPQQFVRGAVAVIGISSGIWLLLR